MRYLLVQSNIDLPMGNNGKGDATSHDTHFVRKKQVSLRLHVIFLFATFSFCNRDNGDNGDTLYVYSYKKKMHFLARLLI